MNFNQELQGGGLVKGVAQAFDRFLRVRTIFLLLEPLSDNSNTTRFHVQEATSFAGRPPAPNLRPNCYALHDLVLTAIVTFSGNVFQAEVQLAGQSRA